MLDNNIQNQQFQNPQFMAITPQQAGQPQVAMQAVNPELLKQNVQDSYVGTRMKASEDTNPFAMLGVGAGVWYLLSQGMDKLNPKCAGEYDKSFLGKLGGWGDRFSQNNYFGRKLEQFTKWYKNKFEALSKKSKIAYTLKNHSTRAEWAFAKVPGAGVHGFLASDTEQVFDEFLQPIVERSRKVGPKYNAFQKLEQYGATQKEINSLIERVKNKPFAEQALELQKEELRRLGVKDADITKLFKKEGLNGLKETAKNLKVQKLGFASMAEYDALKGKFLDNPDKVVKALEKASKNNFTISIWRGKSKVGRNLKGRIVSPSEYLNKYKAVLGLGNKTALGRFLPKLSAWFLEGTTNRFAGGKLAVAMQAGIFADMLIHTFKAPSGEKTKTFAERFVNDFTYFLAMSAGIIGMHKVGGFKYAGVDVNGREEYRKRLADHNQKVKDGLLGDKNAYKQSSKYVDEALGAKNIKNPITKLLHKIGKFINIGNERKLSYRSNSKYNMNFLRKLANGNIIGVPMRILIPMMVVSPFLAKWATKIPHAIFGKPTNSVLDEGKEEEVTQVPPQLQTPQQQVPEQQAIQTTTAQTTNNNGSNLLDQYKNQKNGTTTTTTVTSNSQEPVRTYIPSPIGVQLNNQEDTSSADLAMRRADAAEQLALQTLKMN